VRHLDLALLTVSAILTLGSTISAADRPAAKQVLLLSQSPDGHPPGTHEYVAGMRILAKCLQSTPGIEVQQVRADDPWPEGPELIRKADGVVLFLSEGAKWIHEDPQRLEAFAELSSRGGGLVALHWGMGTKDAQYISGFLKLFGGCHGGPDRKYKVLDAAVEVAQPDHPISRGIEDFKIHEEFYYQLKFVDAETKLKPILQTTVDGSRETVAWAWERGDGGRSFGYSGGHFHDNWGRTEYQRLMAQAVLWTLKLPVPDKGLEVQLSDQDLLLK